MTMMMQMIFVVMAGITTTLKNSRGSDGDDNDDEINADDNN